MLYAVVRRSRREEEMKKDADGDILRLYRKWRKQRNNGKPVKKKAEEEERRRRRREKAKMKKEERKVETSPLWDKGCAKKESQAAKERRDRTEIKERKG
ncbi:hypothetical protein MGYG_08916 [Nannizzia gypsea CBS 118893]|uniref:Uncharacterized protein n=1 Tax=Arthroderma gypseum (strain ATCC MYA-4604 / CBS 118893) TaxID=535722 RepID=E5QYH6_ARTGP|nr:hypothetical protein MGYG_08916 [Nannizzia gypsea CBS 118893]EFQ98052.1 hypothetical protein MGYG_08916 [Nannizzia gypsea CBS 118893]